MASFRKTLYGIFVSPEFIVVLAIVWLTLYPPNIVVGFAEATTVSGPDAVKYVALLPVGIFVWCLAEAKGILFPVEDTKAILVDWPRYADLRVRVLTGLGYLALFTVVSFTAWAYSSHFRNSTCAVAMIVAVVGSLVSGCTFFLASIFVRSIVKRAST